MTAPETLRIENLTESQAELHRRLGPCADCGACLITGPDYTDALCREYVAVDDYLKSENPGWSKAVLNISYLCDKCAKRREAEVQEQKDGVHVYHLVSDAFTRGLLPDACRDVSFDKSSRTAEELNKDAWRRMRAPLVKNLWLIGPPGVGKTWGARCILKRELMDKRRVAELSAMDLCRYARDWHADKHLRRYVEVAVLLIDDLDKTEWHEAGIDALFSLLDKRRGRFIFTSNLEPEKLQKVWQEKKPHNSTIVTAMLERMLPMERIVFTGKSLRRVEG